MRQTDRAIMGGVALAALLVAAPSVAIGHAFLHTRGVVSVTGERLEITLDVEAEDVLHFGDVRVDAADRVNTDELVAALRRHRDRLASGIAVMDEHGTHAVSRIADEPFEVPPGESLTVDALRQLRLPVHLTYTTTGRPRWLTLRALPESELGRVPWQAGLAVRAGDAQRRSIRLTSGGNAETIELERTGPPAVVVASAGAASSACQCGRSLSNDPERFREILADLQSFDNGLLVRVSVPVPVLETWERIARVDGDVLTAGERDSALAAGTGRVARSVTVIVDGRERVGEVVSSGFAPAGESAGAVDASSSVWTTRLVTELQFPTDAPGEIAVIHWSLFNSAVVRARVTVHRLDACSERFLTTYDPMVWPAGNQD